ncbi:hypothetical protein B0H10DRAFT_2206443 [Mycena sp. CBHHK59/15]|nr:hypothetical protein B0H10DRAFT_2206443 [Mycena sp. CBHHK59/15]
MICTRYHLHLHVDPLKAGCRSAGHRSAETTHSGCRPQSMRAHRPKCFPSASHAAEHECGPRRQRMPQHWAAAIGDVLHAVHAKRQQDDPAQWVVDWEQMSTPRRVDRAIADAMIDADVVESEHPIRSSENTDTPIRVALRLVQSFPAVPTLALASPTGWGSQLPHYARRAPGDSVCAWRAPNNRTDGGRLTGSSALAESLLAA